jgi:hypothetical protein
MTDALLFERVCNDGRWVALGIGSIALGSSYMFHFLSYPLAAHTVSLFWVTATIYLSTRLIDDAESGRLRVARIAGLSFCVAMAVITRPTNVLVLPYLVLALERIIRHRLLGRTLALLPVMLICCAPVFLQMWVWHRMIGPWITFSYEGFERFFFEQPRIWQVLVSTRNGLFWWSPMLLLAIAGLVWQLCTSRAARRNEFVHCAVAAFVIVWFFNSCWWSWWFGESWGGRAFTETLLVFMIGMTWLIERISTLQRADVRRAWIGAIGGTIIWEFLLLGLWYTKLLPRANYLVPPWRIPDVTLRS